MKIAITAASGGLGSSIIQQLLKQMPKENIVGLARTPSKAEDLGVEIRYGDYDYKPELIESLSGVDKVLLVSGMDAPDKRIKQHQNVIEAAKNAGVKKIIYTSIVGEVGETSFSPIISSNRQTEDDIRNCGLQWVIGRNGLYIEPDIEYIENYIADGKISNCAANGRCAYTTREELAFAYSRMLVEDWHDESTYNLAGPAITQQQLTEYLNSVFGVSLVYEPISIDEYTIQRKAELGEFLGSVIAGIYSGIQKGSFDVRSDFEMAAGRKHVKWDEYFKSMRMRIQSKKEKE
jgi:NAD(P)H dehydrogenase (quinone)